MNIEPYLLFGIFGIVALLYSSVGHAGASGYIAMLTLAGWSAHEIRPLALVLNLFVASMATYKFHRAGHFRPGLFFLVGLPAVPAAAVGGYLNLSPSLLSKLIGVTLCASAVWLMLEKREPEMIVHPGRFVTIFTGASIGFLAGITGTGGGIFLSPLMLFLGWGKLRQISAIASPYILLNSVAGLIGLSFHGLSLPSGWGYYVIAVLVGGYIGSTLGSQRLSAKAIQGLLSVVLVIAGAKLLL